MLACELLYDSEHAGESVTDTSMVSQVEKNCTQALDDFVRCVHRGYTVRTNCMIQERALRVRVAPKCSVFECLVPYLYA